MVLSAEQYDSLMEDLEILSDPEALARIEQAEAELDRGEYVTLEQLEEELQYNAKKELIVAEKVKRQNAYKTRSLGKRKK